VASKRRFVLGLPRLPLQHAQGPFTRLTAGPVTSTSFTDPNPLLSSTYMVRGLKLETSGSGTYYNLSQGSFVTPAQSDPAPPAITLAHSANVDVSSTAPQVSDANPPPPPTRRRLYTSCHVGTNSDPVADTLLAFQRGRIRRVAANSPVRLKHEGTRANRTPGGMQLVAATRRPAGSRAKLAATGIHHVQLALDPLRQSPKKWNHVVDLLTANQTDIVSGMFGCVGEDYSTLESIRRTGGIALMRPGNRTGRIFKPPPPWRIRWS
jgi:hypothetical protein